jgi:hypothetical protein
MLAKDGMPVGAARHRLPEAGAHLWEAIDLCSRTGHGVMLIDCAAISALTGARAVAECKRDARQAL